MTMAVTGGGHSSLKDEEVFGALRKGVHPQRQGDSMAVPVPSGVGGGVDRSRAKDIGAPNSPADVSQGQRDRWPHRRRGQRRLRQSFPGLPKRESGAEKSRHPRDEG